MTKLMKRKLLLKSRRATWPRGWCCSWKFKRLVKVVIVITGHWVAWNIAFAFSLTFRMFSSSYTSNGSNIEASRDWATRQEHDYNSFDATKSDKGYHSYTVCNGLSNQLLIHAANIAFAIEEKVDIHIPNAFIVDGTQPPNHNGRLANVFPNEFNSVELSEVFDTDGLVETLLHKYGINAKLVKPNPSINMCQWLTTLQHVNDHIVKDILSEFHPSNSVDAMIKLIQGQLLKDGRNIEDGVCLHHRGGEDWNQHCSIWSNIKKDNVWRKNCLTDHNKPLDQCISSRVRDNQWIYYVGDQDTVPSELINQFTITDKYELVGRDMFNSQSRFKGRDMRALVDSFICRTLPNFIGNSVSTWSAIQLSQRTERASWYNSRSIPLSQMWKVYDIPIVYSFSEESSSEVKELLKVSILSVKRHLPNTSISILYYSRKEANDLDFQEWLQQKHVTIYHHDPFSLQDKRKYDTKIPSYEHQYIWNQISQVLSSEYCLLMDYSTIVMKSFTLIDFGLDITSNVALSNIKRMENNSLDQWNGGLALLNLPSLRQETYPEETYSTLDPGFILKPTSKSSQGNPRVADFDGINPKNVLDIWLFNKDCTPKNKYLCSKRSDQNPTCKAMRSLATALTSESDAPHQFCSEYYDLVADIDRCTSFWKDLAQLSEESPCESVISKRDIDTTDISIVYTYTEKSPEYVKQMLKISILSIKKQMPSANVYILYHHIEGTTDINFLSWLDDQDVYSHLYDDPSWYDALEQTNLKKKEKNVLMGSSYLELWQRIDIPNYIYSEFCLHLEYDTIVNKPFSFNNFAHLMTPTIAISSEMDEDEMIPMDAGVTWINLPYLRKKKNEFRNFVLESIGQRNFRDGRLSNFYSEPAFLDKTFSMKPFWKNEETWNDHYIIHFYGLKPLDIMDLWLFGRKCMPAIKFLCDQAENFKLLCPSLQQFALVATLDDTVTVDFCNGYYKDEYEAGVCQQFLIDLASADVLPIGSTCKPKKYSKRKDFEFLTM